MAKSELMTPTFDKGSNLHARPVFVDKKQSATSYESAREALDAARKLRRESNPYQDQITVRFPTDHPITIHAVGDVHLGNEAADLDMFDSHMNAIANTDGAYIVIPSNTVDAFIAAHHPSGMSSNAISAKLQAEAFNEVIKKYEPRILGMVRSPCHEGWIETATSLDIQDIIFKDTDVPRLNNGGTVNLEFPESEGFKLAIYHQFGRGNGSEQNRNAASWSRLRSAKNGEVDAVVAAHSHVSEVEHAFFGQHPNRNEAVLLRSGSYKGNVSGEKDAVEDTFQKDYSGFDGEPGGQSITFNPRTGSMRVHMNPLRSAIYQRDLNKFTTLEDTGKFHELFNATAAFAADLGKPAVKAVSSSVNKS